MIWHCCAHGMLMIMPHPRSMLFAGQTTHAPYHGAWAFGGVSRRSRRRFKLCTARGQSITVWIHVPAARCTLRCVILLLLGAPLRAMQWMPLHRALWSPGV